MIDVSNNNGYVYWWSVRRIGGQKIAAIKCSEGSNLYSETFYDDLYFHYNMLGAHRNGIVALPYFFARPGTSALDQARHFLERCRPYIRRGAGNLVLDIEDAGGLEPPVLRAWVRTWLSIVGSVTRQKPIIYTYSAFTRNLGTEFVEYPLWIANYDGKQNLPPNSIGAWKPKNVYAHQWSDKGSCYGVIGNVDISRRYVSLRKFKIRRKISW